MAERLFEPERMRAPATTATILFQRFYMRHSFTVHDYNVIAIACLFYAAKVEEMQRRVRSLIDASFCVQSGMDRSPFEEGSTEWRARRDAILEAERVLLHTLEFDASVEQPYPLITAALRRWKENGMFGSRTEKIPELQALDRAAGVLAFVCIAGSESIPLLFSTREIAYGSLYLAYSLSSPAVQHRLRIAESAFAAAPSAANASTATSSINPAGTGPLGPLMDMRLLVAFTERAGEMIQSLRRGEERLCATVPLVGANCLGAAAAAASASAGATDFLSSSSLSASASGGTTSGVGGGGSSSSSAPVVNLSDLPSSIIEALGARFGAVASGIAASSSASMSRQPSFSSYYGAGGGGAGSTQASMSIATPATPSIPGSTTTAPPPSSGIFGNFGASLLGSTGPAP